MKIIEASAGALTNFEVLDLLRSRGAGKDPTRAIASVSTSEFEVFDYLENSAACNQTRDIVHKFVGECKKFDLAKAEVLNIINIRPANLVGIDSILEGSDPLLRLGDTAEELIETIEQILPPEPSQVKESNEETAEGEEEAGHPEPNAEETAEGEEEAEHPEPNAEETAEGEEEAEHPEPNAEETAEGEEEAEHPEPTAE